MNELEQVIEHHRRFWTKGAGPLLCLYQHKPLSKMELPLVDGTPLTDDMYLTPRILDPSLLLDLEESPPKPRLQPDRPGGVTGDVLIIRRPMTKMCWVEAIMGCPVRMQAGAGSIYSEPCLKGPDGLDKIPTPYINGWLNLLVDYTRGLVEKADNRYYVSLPLMRGTIDLVAALLGYGKMYFSFYDQPRQLLKLIERCTETFVKVVDALYTVIPKMADGRVSYYSLWAPGAVVRTQCDASAAISANTYEKFFFPYEIEICSSFNYSIMHLHSGYLHTIDIFLKSLYPTAIQISLDTGSTPLTTKDLIPVFKKVLERKPLIIQGRCNQRELSQLLQALPSDGLCILAELTDMG